MSPDTDSGFLDGISEGDEVTLTYMVKESGEEKTVSGTFDRQEYTPVLYGHIALGDGRMLSVNPMGQVYSGSLLTGRRATIEQVE